MTDRVFERNSQMEAGHDVDVNKVLGLDGPWVGCEWHGRHESEGQQR
jgi:hypothetical protein